MVGVARPESSNGVEQAKTTPFEDSGRATQPLIHLAGVFVLLAGTVTGCHKADSVAPPEQADASSYLGVSLIASPVLHCVGEQLSVEKRRRGPGV